MKKKDMRRRKDFSKQFDETTRYLNGEDIGVTNRVVPAQSVFELRMKFGMTQQEFADFCHIPVSTIRNWEQSRNSPDEAAQTLIWLLEHDASAFDTLRSRPTHKPTPNSPS